MLSFYCLLYLICLPGFTDQKILGISVPVNLCFNQSSFLLYWQKVRFYIRFFPVNKDCNRDMARFPPVFDTNPPATACCLGLVWSGIDRVVFLDKFRPILILKTCL